MKILLDGVRMAKGKVLIVEDERDIVEMIEYNLDEAGYETIAALNGEDGLKLARKGKPDLVILDLMLPVMDGFEVCRELRGAAATAHIPIIILSAKSQETDKVLGLELGADDYVTKPFSPRELLARIKAVLRRGKSREHGRVLKRGRLVIDGARHKVSLGNMEILLTLTEFKLLEFLAARPGIVLSRNRILDAVAGYDAAVSDRTVDAHVKALRRKLGDAKDYVETVRGAGYRFKEF